MPRSFSTFVAVAGGLSLESLEQLISGAQNEKRFLAHMLNGALAFRPPLGFFNRLRSDKRQCRPQKRRHRDRSWVWRGSAAWPPARASDRPSRRLRRQPPLPASVLSPESAQEFAEIFPVLLRLRLRAQLAARKKGQPLENSVNLAELSTLEKRHLKESSIIIKDTQEDLRAAWQLDRLG